VVLVHGLSYRRAGLHTYDFLWVSCLFSRGGLNIWYIYLEPSIPGTESFPTQSPEPCHSKAMADPLSVAGSLAGLVTITDLVFCRAYKYWKAVKGAPAEAVALTSAIGAFSGILHNLYLLAHQLDGESFDTTTQIHHIRSCLKTVETVERFLNKYGKSSSGHGMDTMKRLRWPFMEPEAKSLTIQIERHKASLNLALAADGISGLLQALSGQKDIRSDLDVIKVELRQRREADTRIAISTERQEILAWIQIHDPRQNHEMSLNLRHPSTGLWLIESVEVCILLDVT